MRFHLATSANWPDCLCMDHEAQSECVIEAVIADYTETQAVLRVPFDARIVPSVVKNTSVPV